MNLLGNTKVDIPVLCSVVLSNLFLNTTNFADLLFCPTSNFEFKK